jgi:predicted transcriptional regulator
MLHVWKLKLCAVKDVWNELDEPRPPYTTIASVFRNLDQKGYLTSKKYGNVNVFSPRISEEEYKKAFMSSVVKSYFENSYKELVSFFVKEEKISSRDLREIIHLIETDDKKLL